MKVSKPILILCVVMLLLAGYIHFFTGKKKPKGPAPVSPPAQAQTQPAEPQPAQPSSGGQQAALPEIPGKSEPVAPRPKPQFDKLRMGWASDPFILPVIKGKKSRDDGSAVRLVAILERGSQRVAVIDRDVVKKGDMIGNEKVVEIGRDMVVLTRGGTKRTLVLADADPVAADEALTAKPKSTERPK